jgi:two-component system, NtrC family, sensor kinase
MPAIPMQKFWTRLSLSQKIVFPFLTVCLGAFMFCLFTVGHWFTDNLEQNMHQEVKIFAERVYQDFQYQQQTLENQIKLIVDRDAVRNSVERQDRSGLLKILLPLRSFLDLDWIKVFDTKGNTLLDARSSQLGQVKLLDRSIASSAMSGAFFSDLVDVEGGQQTLQAVIHPIKSSAGLLGGMIVAQLVDDELLQKIATGSSKHLIAIGGNRVIATTLPAAHHITGLTVPKASTIRLAIDDQQYLARNVYFAGASQSLAIIVLQPISQLEAAKKLLWERFGLVFLLGSIIVAIVGVLIARAIIRPLRAVSEVARKVTRDSNFDLQAPVLTQDEVGVVAISLNQLIQQVRQLLILQQEDKEQLKIYNQTLEQQVESRTEELQQKNTDLQQTLQKLKQAQSQLIQGEKMSALGQLVAGIAHEINNPVNFIYANLTYVNQYTQDLLRLVNTYQQNYPNPPQSLQAVLKDVDIDYLNEDLTKILQSMQVGSDRIREIVLSLRNFSRLDEAELKWVNLYEGIDNTLMILQHRLKANSERPAIEVVKEYVDLPLVECCAGQLNQVFMNLLANAIDALEESNLGRSFQDIAANPNRIWIRTLNPTPNQVQITIADNGCGIPENVRSRLFDPFFTTKQVGKGTGLGLSISYQVVTEKHRGKLWCDSTPSAGTKFVIELPISGTSSMS